MIAKKFCKQLCKFFSLFKQYIYLIHFSPNSYLNSLQTKTVCKTDISEERAIIKLL